MKRLIVVILVAAAAWAGYWFVVSSGVKSGFAAWFEDRHSDGWVADYSNLSVVGFPNRVDTRLKDLVLADPETGWVWEAKQFEIAALSYRPNHVIVTWPDSQLLATPLGKSEILADSMQASVVVDGNSDLALNRTNFVSEKLFVKSEQDTTYIESLRAAIERQETDNSYRFAVTADGLEPSIPLKRRIDPQNRLPQAFEAFRADLTVDFDRPWDRHAIEDARPQPSKIALRLAEAKWGELHLQMAGDLDVDTQGRANGRLVIKARNWREILTMARASNELPESFLDTVETALDLASRLSGNKQTLDIPLDFNRGRISLGPVPLGTAPLIRLR